MTTEKAKPVPSKPLDTTDRSSRPKQPRGLRTRARIVAAASDVMGDVGYAKTTTKAIAEAAGVAEGTIYRHFEHKRELMLAAVLHRNQDVVESILTLPDLAGTATVADNLAHAMRSLGSLRADLLPIELEALGRLEIREGDDLDVSAEEALFGPDQLFADYLRREQALGRVRKDFDANLSANLILTTLFGVGIAPTSRNPDRYRDLLDHAIRVIATAIAEPT